MSDATRVLMNNFPRIADHSLCRPGLALAALLILLLFLSACSTPVLQAPVEVRKTPPKSVVTRPGSSGGSAGSAKTVDGAKPALPGAENAGKPGFYTVEPGDSVIKIALAHGQSPKDITRWNALENPNRIEVGQVLRVQPPGAESAAISRGVAMPRAETRPLDGKPLAAAGTDRAASAADSASEPAAGTTGAPSKSAGDDIPWRWPSDAPVVEAFDGKKNLGIDLGGQAGDPVMAAADGRVIWVGDAPRGLGKLIIIKHVGDYLTAYAHNQKLLVEENAAVRQGQKIAEMGSSDADRVKLHFEIRKFGKPLDPMKFLPPRGEAAKPEVKSP
jgi:lipoprotein NlpD